MSKRINGGLAARAGLSEAQIGGLVTQVSLLTLLALYLFGGETINARFPGFDPQFLRLRPRRIVTWGVEVSSSEDTGAHGRDI